MIIDVDASLVASHSEREGATPTWKRGFGFPPMLGFLAELRALVDDATEHCPVCRSIRGNVAMQVTAQFDA